MSAKDNVIAAALKLTEAERLEVAERLFESLDGAAEPGAEQAWEAEIERRLSEVDSGRGKFVSWPEARKRISGEADGEVPG